MQKNLMYTRLKDLREDADLSQEQFAEKLGLYTTTYARYERGESILPLDLAIQIANYHKVSLDYLAGRASTPTQKEKTDTIEILINGKSVHKYSGRKIK